MKKLNKEDLPKLKEFSKKAQYNEYNSNVVTMVMWDHVYEIFYELHENFALILVNYHHRFDFYQYYPSLAKHLFEKYQLPMRLEKDYHEYPYEYAINQTYFLNTHDDIHKYLIGDIIEMPCHVGFVVQSIMEMSSLNLQRMEDHALVTSSRFKKLYHDLGYQLIGWNQLQKKTRNSY